MSDPNLPAYGANSSQGQPNTGGIGEPYQPGGQPVLGPTSGAPYTPAPQQPPQKLPGRGLPITLTVLGSLVLLIGVPFAFAAGFLFNVVGSAGDLVDGIDTSKVVESQQVQVDSNLMVMAKGTQSDLACEVRGADGTLQQPSATNTSQVEEESFTTLTYSPDQAGMYDVSCVSSTGEPALVKAYPLDLEGIVGGSVVPVIVVGLIGLVMLVVGIVWLVKRNKQRREILATSFGTY